MYALPLYINLSHVLSFDNTLKMHESKLLFLLIVVALGFFPKQGKRYWLFAVSAVAIILVAHLLFNVDLYGGWYDGYITTFVRQAQQNDFNIYGMFSLEIIFGWVIPLYLIYKGYKRKEKSLENLDKKK